MPNNRWKSRELFYDPFVVFTSRHGISTRRDNRAMAPIEKARAWTRARSSVCTAFVEADFHLSAEMKIVRENFALFPSSRRKTSRVFSRFQVDYSLDWRDASAFWRGGKLANDPQRGENTRQSNRGTSNYFSIIIIFFFFFWQFKDIEYDSAWEFLR